MLPLVIFLGIFVFEVQCGYFFVMGPNVIRFDHEETVVVSVFDLTNAAVNVWLEHENIRFSERYIVVENQKAPKFTSVKVTENDLLSAKYGVKVRKVKLCSEWNGVKTTRDILLSYHSGYLITQTNKPIYTPLERVFVRTLALDESLKAVNDWEVGMDLISPSNKILARRLIKDRNFGFFESYFNLPPYPEIGNWSARSFYTGQFETESRAFFEVREYVLPTFGVKIDVDVESILQSTSKITVTVKAIYVFGKPVEGYARLTLNLKDDNKYSDYILSVPTKRLETNSDVEGSLIEFHLDVQDVFTSSLFKDKPFPDGKRLEVIATVSESATGHEETASHDGTFFTKTPFVFKFTKSKLNFRPGLPYSVKVQVLHANGNPAKNINVRLKWFEDDVFNGEGEGSTDDDGRIMLFLSTSPKSSKISFKASTNDEHESDVFVVTAHAGKNQIQAECLQKGHSIMVMRASTNIKGNSYTGMLFMVITRGKILFAKYKEPANVVDEEISYQLQEIASPDARFLVFYVDKSSGELVADSVKFELEKKCRGEGLNLTAMEKVIFPGDRVTITIAGSPYMYVGLNIIDKALLLLNDKNVLKKDKMFETLQSHDLGCGEGSGKSGADVIKKSGLTVLTNAVIDEADIERKTADCMTSKRKRRGADSGFYGSEEKCCHIGNDLAQSLYNEEGYTAHVNPRTICYPKTLILATEKRLSMNCARQIFKSCVDNMEYFLNDKKSFLTSLLDDTDDLTNDMMKLASNGYRYIIREYFSESLLFEVIRLDRGIFRRETHFPDSVTKWKIQAIGITKDQGLCIADPVELKVFRDFFIRLNLPYKTARLEHFSVEATIFNYGWHDETASVYLEGSDNLCYYSNPGESYQRVQVNIPAKRAKTINFPMIPLESGIHPVKVHAMNINDIVQVDIIQKKLLFVKEGIEQKIAIVVCLDPQNQKEDCVNDKRVIEAIQASNDMKEYVINLTLPENSISQSGSAIAYIQSNIMINVVNTLIEGVDTLLRQPYGNGEQTMISLAQTVYAHSYLQQMKQITADVETKGNQWIRDGIDREISQYRHADGSYSARRSRTASTWLTAFVAKVFCQANAVVDDALEDMDDIKITINWLKDHMNVDGSFKDVVPVIQREMIGQIIEKEPTLTAFVLITLQECNIKSKDLDITIQKASKYLENLHERYLKNNPYLLAISTYALALSDSKEKYNFKKLLLDIKKDEVDGSYWGVPGGKPANANSVETTAYALLAMLKFNDLRISSSIASWLTSQRDGKRPFTSTQETVVGLQALTQYSKASYSPEVELRVTFYEYGWGLKEKLVTQENAVVPQVFTKLPIGYGKNKFKVRVQGTGSAIMTIDLRYNRLATEEETCPFSISDIDVQDVDDKPIDPLFAEARNCDICGYCDGVDDDYATNNCDKLPKIDPRIVRTKRAVKCVRFSVSSKDEKKTFGTSIVKFGLETDVKVIKSDLEKLVSKNNTNIARFEMPSDGQGFVLFYLNEITSSETNFIFRLDDDFIDERELRQPSFVSVYDEYNPDDHCTQFYSTRSNKDKSVSYQCDKNNRECTCFKNACVQPVKAEIEKLYKQNKKPAIRLFKYACNTDKANYAVQVKIEDIDSLKKVARGVVETSFHNGNDTLEKGEKITFVWQPFCTEPLIEEGKSYIIIGQDGEEKFRYPLMEKTLVIEHITIRQYRRNKRKHGMMYRVLTAFQRLMKARGCLD